MSLYDTLQKTKQELPYRFQRLQNEANAKRAETVTPNTNQVSREQGIRDSYRKRVEQEQQAKDNLEKAIQMTVGGYNISPGSSLIQKAVQNTIGQDISRDYFKQAVGDETTIGGVLQKQIDILGDQISKRQNELNERLAEETVSGEPILDPLRNQITSMSQQWRDTKDKLKMLNQLESAMNSSYEQQELLSPDEYKSQVQDLQKQIDTLMEQERVWQDAQYSNALGMEYLGGNVPAQSVQSEIDKLVAQRDKLNALIPEAESVQWENKMKDEILAAGGEDLLRQIMELSRQKQEQEYDNSNYTDYKNAVDALKAQGYDQKTLNDWFAYAERIRNREEYQKSMEWAQSFAQEHPVASSIVSVPINLVSGVGALDVLGQNITKNFTGRPVDYRTPAMQFSGEANTIRGQVASDIENATDDWALSDTKFGNAYSTGYQLLMSMADSLGAAGLSAVGVPFSGALLGGSAATNAITEARGRGASDGQAIVYGLMAGVAETLFESLSIESLVKLDDPSTVRAAILNILKQGGVEASEELNTSIANTMSDLLVMGPKSQLLTDKRNYLDNGFSQKEASRLAMSNWFNGLMGDALGGFLSGGMMSAFSRPIQSLGQYRNQNNNALDAAIQETMKPTQELDNLNNAIDGLFAQNKTAQADTGAESTNVNTNPDSMPKVTMADFTDRLSAVFNNLEYGDTKTQTEITQKTHQDMVSSGEVVKIPESTLEQTESYYPDLRGMKKQERAPILKQKITELKTVLRKFLNGMKGGTYEFEVNGNILEAKLYDTGVREVMDKITQNKASMLLHSEEVFKNARYLYSTPDYEGDPNIYRWNYFYTPVDIGGETVGVRIAVRDIALGQNNIPESQIYNWNIKKDAALGGEKLGTNAASPDTSSAASDNNSIRGNSENVNGKSNMEQAVDALFPGLNENTADMDHGAVGAAESGFSPYSHYQNQTDNFMPEGAYAARPVDMPAVDPTGKPVRSGAKTIYGAQTTSDARAEQMETEFMEGLYGYDPVRDKPTLEKAKYTIEQEGYDRAYARVTERLQSMKKLKETGLEAYLLYADAVKNGKDADAAELCLLLTQSGTEFGQGIQLFSMFRKLTPEGQLMGVERLVQRINDKYAGSDQKTAIPDYARNDVIREITDVRDTALRLLENIQAVFDKTGQNHGVPVEDWIQEIGDRLAKSLEKTSENSSQLTVSKTIQNDLRRFAKSYFDKNKPGNRYSNAQALENFLNNRDQYTEAWDEARWYLSNKYKNDPSMLDALNDFMTSGISIESIGSGIDTDIKKAMNDIGVKTKDIIRKSNADKDSTSKQIAEMLMKDHNLSNEDADTMANFIIDRFNQHISDASELVLKNMFAPKDKKAKKTFEQNFYELANMGAFTNENWKDAVSKKLFGHEISIDENLISEFRNAQDQDTRDAVMEKIYENIGKQIPTTFSEAMSQWRYTAMLLNPSTHIKNMGGNLSMMAMKLGKDAVGAGIEKAANAVTGGKVGRTKSVLNVFSKSDQALMQKAWADFENVQDDVAGIGKNKDNIMGKVGEYRDYWKLNDPQGNAAKLVDGVLRGAEKVPKSNSAMMDAEDMIFSQPDYAVSLAGYMKANKLTEITPEARDYAIKEAQKATFRDANAVSNFARKMGTGDHKFWNFLINAIFPFKGTPANVGVRAFEYSPAGLLKALTYDIYRVKTGKISATEYIDNLASGLTGSALSAVGYFLAQAGFLRATGVGDEKEKEQQRQQGYKDNSFTLFGHSIPENVFTSASAPMFVGAAFYEALATKALTGEIYSWDEVLQVLAATADPILGQTMLDGLSDTFYTIRSTQGGIGEVTAALLANTAGNYLSSLMPTILSRISSASDSVGRETYADKNKQLTGIQKEVQGLMMKTPARQMLHEKVDNYGRVQETWNPFGDDNAAEKSLNFLTNVVTPTYPSKIKDTPVEDELNRLYQSGADTSDKKIFQTEAAKSFKVDGKTINLTADQHEEFEKIRGENTMEYQGALQNSELYDNLDDSLKVYATDEMYDFIEQTSKDLLGIGYSPDDWVSELKGKSQEEIAEAVIMKTMESYAKSDNFSSKYDGITSMLDSGAIDAAMAVSMLPKEASDGYYNYIQGSGVELGTYIDLYQFKNNAKSDKDKDGKTIKSAQEKVIEYINKVGRGPGQKRRMFLAMGYSEKNLPEEWK